MVRFFAIVQSVLFHGAVIGLFFFSLPYWSDDLTAEQPVLTVEIVDTVAITNLSKGIKTDSIDEVKNDTDTVEEELPPPPPKPTPPKPTPPKPAPPKETPAEKSETVPLPEAEPLPAPPPPKSKPSVQEESKTVVPPPKRPEQKSPSFKKRAAEQAVLTAALQNLAAKQAEQRRKEKEKKELEDKQRKALEDKIKSLSGQALNTQKEESKTLGASVTDKLRNHLAGCWSPPPGAAGAEALNVDIIVRLNAQAEVENVEIEDKARLQRDAFFKAAALAARRAMIECSPLPLPLDQYELWKELALEFNPRFITRQ